MFISRHLPNLCLAQEFFGIVVKGAVSVVKGAVGLVVGAAVGVAVAVGATISAAIHLAAAAFHFMIKTLGWVLKGIEHAFIYLRKKVKNAIKKVIKFVKHIGGKVIEAAEDTVGIVVDVAHHATHHHKCKNSCPANTVIVVGDVPADTCACKPVAAAAAIVDVCSTATREFCSEKQFSAAIKTEYNVELQWTEKEAIKEVTTHSQAVFGAIAAIESDQAQLEASVVAGIEANVAPADSQV